MPAIEPSKWIVNFPGTNCKSCHRLHILCLAKLQVIRLPNFPIGNSVGPEKILLYFEIHQRIPYIRCISIDETDFTTRPLSIFLGVKTIPCKTCPNLCACYSNKFYLRTHPVMFSSKSKKVSRSPLRSSVGLPD